jgi:C1A family cysteine protease
MNIKSYLVAVSFLSLSALSADDLSYVKYGLARLESHELEHLENSMHKVIEVSPNFMGFDRINQHLEKSNLPFLESCEGKHEYGTLQASSHAAHDMLFEGAHVPSAVDNSTLPAFPPIGDQGRLGSCVGWASTYYQASHELALLHGWDNKKSLDHVLSPKWTYNLVNKGTNVGASPILAYQVLQVNGAPSIQDFPYDNDFKAWDLNSDHWISAISNRMAPATLIPGLGGDKKQNLTAIKQALNNGHILTLASFIDSWVFTKTKPDPENPNAPHVGEFAAYYMNGYKGGHFMTVVGYDDDIWIDINQNGRVDEGERGAFLIANSWGTNWGNKGFVWIAYDAFLSQSKVPNGPSNNRIAAGVYLSSGLIAVAPKAEHYTPSLVAEFSISQVERNQISIHTGISRQNEQNPTATFAIPAFANEGGAFEFDGKVANNPQAATFAIDLSDYLSDSNLPTSKRYYLLVGDNAKGKPTTLNSFSLIDLVNNQKIESLIPLPRSYDNEVGSLYIDY